MPRTWIEPHEVSLPPEVQAEVGGSPLLSRILLQRGICQPSQIRGFLDPQHYSPASPSEIPDLELAVGMLEETIAAGKEICVWGDFDVDGQTATTLLVSALRSLGARVSYHLPVRLSESHGINRAALEAVLQQGVSLILTCDTGISENDSIAYSISQGVPVIVTDHHELPPVLPSAAALVNPKRLPEHHPLSTLPGVGVAFKLVEALFHRQGWESQLGSLLDLVALGAVADVALLQGDTRYLTQLGLEALRRNQRPGLQAMLEIVSLNPEHLTEEHIGYILGPRLNALGRLSDANKAIEFLSTADLSKARLMAYELEALNSQRKLVSDQVFQAAQSMLEAEPGMLDDPVLILSHPAWPAGVIGIVASRLVEHYRKPVILISTPPGENGRASVRSVEGINIMQALTACQDELVTLGGHPMAAGFSIQPQRIPDFRRLLTKAMHKMEIPAAPPASLQVDGYLSLADLTMDLVQELERLAPYGPGNPSAILATRNLSLVGYSAVGKNDEHLVLTIEDEYGNAQRCIWWQGAGWPLPEGAFDLAYSVRASTYRGQRDVQVEWLDYRPLERPLVPIKSPSPAVQVVDYRQELHPLPILQRLQSQPASEVWAEGDTRHVVNGQNRFNLVPAEILAIWTIPPSQEVLSQAIQLVQPRQVYLFASHPDTDLPDQFLKRLAGLLKFRLQNHAGSASLNGLAAACAQTIKVIQKGLEWLESHGHITLEQQTGDLLQVSPGSGKHTPDDLLVTSKLKTLLTENAAYRSYYLVADKDKLVNPE